METLKIAKELVGIKSASVQDGEIEVARYISEVLEGIGISSKIIRFGGNRADIIAEVGEGEGLMLNGHMDTVPIGDSKQWNYNPYGQLSNGRLYGRGASDMKGGIAAMLSALSNSKLGSAKRRLAISFVADEEVAFAGSLLLLKEHKGFFDGVKYGIIGEPTDMKIEIAQKGIVDMTICFRGKAAHGSKPWLGVNAIQKAAIFVTEYAKLADDFGIKDDVLGKGTVNIGTINGGTAINVVPDSCTITVDRRIVPGETATLASRQISSLLRRLGIRASVKIRSARPPFRINMDSKILKLLKEAHNSRLGGSAGYTEAELYKSYAGIDSVVFSPGVNAVIHKSNEYIRVADLNAASKVYGKIIDAWLH